MLINGHSGLKPSSMALPLTGWPCINLNKNKDPCKDLDLYHYLDP